MPTPLPVPLRALADAEDTVRDAIYQKLSSDGASWLSGAGSDALAVSELAVATLVGCEKSEEEAAAGLEELVPGHGADLASFIWQCLPQLCGDGGVRVVDHDDEEEAEPAAAAAESDDGADEDILDFDSDAASEDPSPAPAPVPAAAAPAAQETAAATAGRIVDDDDDSDSQQGHFRKKACTRRVPEPSRHSKVAQQALAVAEAARLQGLLRQQKSQPQPMLRAQPIQPMQSLQPIQPLRPVIHPPAAPPPQLPSSLPLQLQAEATPGVLSDCLASFAATPGCTTRECFLVRRPEERTGFSVQEPPAMRTVFLISVDSGSPAERCGLGSFIGRRLTHINGCTVQSIADCKHFSRCVALRVTFEVPLMGGVGLDRRSNTLMQAIMAAKASPPSAHRPAPLFHPPPPPPQPKPAVRKEFIPPPVVVPAVPPANGNTVAAAAAAAAAAAGLRRPPEPVAAPPPPPPPPPPIPAAPPAVPAPAPAPPQPDQQQLKELLKQQMVGQLQVQEREYRSEVQRKIERIREEEEELRKAHERKAEKRKRESEIQSMKELLMAQQDAAKKEPKRRREKAGSTDEAERKLRQKKRARKERERDSDPAPDLMMEDRSQPHLRQSTSVDGKKVFTRVAGAIDAEAAERREKAAKLRAGLTGEPAPKRSRRRAADAADHVDAPRQRNPEAAAPRKKDKAAQKTASELALLLLQKEKDALEEKQREQQLLKKQRSEEEQKRLDMYKAEQERQRKEREQKEDLVAEIYRQQTRDATARHDFASRHQAALQPQMHAVPEAALQYPQMVPRVPEPVAAAPQQDLIAALLGAAAFPGLQAGPGGIPRISLHGSGVNFGLPTYR